MGLEHQQGRAGTGFEVPDSFHKLIEKEQQRVSETESYSPKGTRCCLSYRPRIWPSVARRYALLRRERAAVRVPPQGRTAEQESAPARRTMSPTRSRYCGSISTRRAWRLPGHTMRSRLSPEPRREAIESRHRFLPECDIPIFEPVRRSVARLRRTTCEPAHAERPTGVWCRKTGPPESGAGGDRGGPGERANLKTTIGLEAPDQCFRQGGIDQHQKKRDAIDAEMIGKLDNGQPLILRVPEERPGQAGEKVRADQLQGDPEKGCRQKPQGGKRRSDPRQGSGIDGQIQSEIDREQQHDECGNREGYFAVHVHRGDDPESSLP